MWRTLPHSEVAPHGILEKWPRDRGAPACRAPCPARFCGVTVLTKGGHPHETIRPKRCILASALETTEISRVAAECPSCPGFATNGWGDAADGPRPAEGIYSSRGVSKGVRLTYWNSSNTAGADHGCTPRTTTGRPAVLPPGQPPTYPSPVVEVSPSPPRLTSGRPNPPSKQSDAAYGRRRRRAGPRRR